MKICFINISEYPIPFWNLASLITNVKKDGHWVSLLDLTFIRENCRAKHVMDTIEKERPDIITFSQFSQWHVKLSEAIKRKFNNTLVAWGGGYVTLFSEEVISYPTVDAICIGEGEITFVEYLRCLERAQAPNVPGMWYKKNGAIIQNRLRSNIDNLDSLSIPEWDGWDIERYLKVCPRIEGGMYFVASKGCPYNCSFCGRCVEYAVTPGEKYRVRSASQVVDEISLFKDKYWSKGFRYVLFWDEIFGLDQKQFTDFTDLYIKRGLSKKVPWLCQTRPEVITEDWAKKASQSGCFLVELGLETANERMRMDVYKKEFTNRTFKKATEYLKKYNIQFLVLLIIGGPHDSYRDIFSSIKFSRKLSPLSYCLSTFHALAGTSLFKKCSEERLFKTQGTKSCSVRPKGTNPIFLLPVIYLVKLQKLIFIFKKGLSLMKQSFALSFLKTFLNIKNARQVKIFSEYIVMVSMERIILRYYAEQKSRKDANNLSS